jgi:hypothetical protein
VAKFGFSRYRRNFDSRCLKIGYRGQYLAFKAETNSRLEGEKECMMRNFLIFILLKIL